MQNNDERFSSYKVILDDGIEDKENDADYKEVCEEREELNNEETNSTQLSFDYVASKGEQSGNVEKTKVAKELSLGGEIAHEKTQGVDFGTNSSELIKKLGDVKAVALNIENLITSKLVKEKTKDDLIKSMNEELEKYKNDLYFTLIKPFIMDLISMREGLKKTKALYETKLDKVIEKSNAKVIDDFQNQESFKDDDFAADIKKVDKRKGCNSFQEAIDAYNSVIYDYDLWVEEMSALLEKSAVEIYDVDGNDYDSERQKIIKVENIEDDLLDKKVKKKLSDGYCYNGKNILMQKVIVYKKV